MKNPILARVLYFVLGFILGTSFSFARAAEPSPANTEVFFDTDKSNIKPSEEAKIHDLAAFIVHHDAVVTLVGNADKRASRLYNLDLGFRRAESVKAKLVEYGVDPSSVIIATSYGEERPKAPNDMNPANLQKNRRTDAVVMQVKTRIVQVPVPVPVPVTKEVLKRHRIFGAVGYAPSGLKGAKKTGPSSFTVEEDWDTEIGLGYSYRLNSTFNIGVMGFSNKSGFFTIGVDF